MPVARGVIPGHHGYRRTNPASFVALRRLAILFGQAIGPLVLDRGSDLCKRLTISQYLTTDD